MDQEVLQSVLERWSIDEIIRICTAHIYNKLQIEHSELYFRSVARLTGTAEWLTG